MCIEIRDDLSSTYGWNITGSWTLQEMLLLASGVSSILDAFEDAGLLDPTGSLNSIVSDLEIRRVHKDTNSTADGRNNLIKFTNFAFYENKRNSNNELVSNPSEPRNDPTTIVHELAHIWDYRSDREPSKNLQEVVDGKYEYFGGLTSRFEIFPQLLNPIYTVQIASPKLGNTPSSHREDFAWTFAIFVVDQQNVEAKRSQYINQLIRTLGP